jgi:GAF domain-containing protein
MGRPARPTKGKKKDGRPLVGKVRKKEGARVSDLERLAGALKREAAALAQQTATSEILRVISSSPTDVQPVFDTIVRSAVQLCGAIDGTVVLVEADQIQLIAEFNFTHEQRDLAHFAYPVPLAAASPGATSIRTGVVYRAADIETEPEWQTRSEAMRMALRSRGVRSDLVVPMTRRGEVIGAIILTHRDVGAFTDAHVALIQTFADQAVIAIENVRLFKELQTRTEALSRSVSELQALSEVGQAISSTLDLQTVLSTIVARATQLADTDAGVIYEYDDQREVFLPRATEHLEAEIIETLLATPVRKGEGATGRLAEVQEPIQLPDILVAPSESRVRGALVRAGYRERAPLPRDRDQGPAARGREPAQVAIPREHEPRAADSAQRHHRPD